MVKGIWQAMIYDRDTFCIPSYLLLLELIEILILVVLFIIMETGELRNRYAFTCIYVL